MTQYKVLTGIDYPPDKRVEAGSIVSDLPEKSAKWLLDQGLIELMGGKTNTAVPAKTQSVEVKEPAKVEFDPEATDGDSDGFVQDGTPFQRPVEEKE
jgi:hypothetical protein